MMTTMMIRSRRWMEGPLENEIVRLGERMRIQWTGTKQERIETIFVENDFESDKINKDALAPNSAK